MLTLIARQEWLHTQRDRRFWLLTAVVWGLLLVATFVGLRANQRLRAERAAAAQDARNQWLGQGDKNPHSAAHYGTYAFRPRSELGFLDFGVDSFLGTAVYLEGHRQNDARYTVAQDAGTLLRFGELTVAFVLQLLLPLLLIFLCFNTFTREREGNTLRLLLAQGATGRQLAFGKALGLAGVAALITLPALALAVGGLFAQSDATSPTADWGGRAAWLLTFYVLYSFIWVILSVGVSARSRTSAQALLVLLGGWMLFCVLIPKATANLGATLYEAPTRFAFSKTIHDDVAQGLDGHDPEDERMKLLEKKVLAQYGVDSLSQLPINFDGLAMQEGEIYTSRVYNQHFGALQETFRRQNRVSDWAGLVNPYLAIRSLSMGLSGSDYSQSVDFARAAETYRFRMVEYLNNYMRDHSKTGDWQFKVSIWDQLPDFRFTPPGVGTVLERYVLSVVALLGWALGGLVALGFVANRISPV